MLATFAESRHSDNEIHRPETGIELPNQSVEPRRRGYLWLKAAFDRVAGLVMLMLSAPVIVVAAIVVKLTSRGPAFYSQTRLGANGRPFTLIKLRTMIQNAEALTGPVWSQKDDPRVTPFGQFLRDTHIDEFPQLLNVLLGQLSIVGPRPERPEIAARLDLEVPQYPSRLNVRPGITGLAQLLLPPDSDVESVRNKLIYDLYYVRYVGLWLDFRILVFTATHLLKVLGYYVLRPLNLPKISAIQTQLQSEYDQNSCFSFAKPGE